MRPYTAGGGAPSARNAHAVGRRKSTPAVTWLHEARRLTRNAPFRSEIEFSTAFRRRSTARRPGNSANPRRHEGELVDCCKILAFEAMSTVVEVAESINGSFEGSEHAGQSSRRLVQHDLRLVLERAQRGGQLFRIPSTTSGGRDSCQSPLDGAGIAQDAGRADHAALHLELMGSILQKPAAPRS